VYTESARPVLFFYLLPVTAVEAPILNCFGQMFGRDTRIRIEVGDGSRNFQNPVVRPRRQAQPPNRHFERPLTRIVESAQASQLPHRNLSVVVPASPLNRAGAFDALANFRRSRPLIFAAQFLIRHRRNFNMQIDPIEQRPANLS
jgi:hypothetical protein